MTIVLLLLASFQDCASGQCQVPRRPIKTVVAPVVRVVKSPARVVKSVPQRRVGLLARLTKRRGCR